MTVPLRLAALALVGLVPASAAADESLHASLGLTSGYTDNLSNAADDASDLDARPKVGDLFAVIAPGLRFTHQTPRFTQVAHFTWSARLYQEHSEGNSYASTAGYEARLQLTPRSTLSAGLTFVNGRSNQFDFTQPGTPVQLRPDDDIAFYTLGGQVSYVHDLSRDWRLGETILASTYQPIETESTVGTSATVGNELTFVRAFGHNEVTTALRASYLTLEREVDGGVVRAEGAFAGPEVRWLHDLTPRFTTILAAGALASAPADDLGALDLVPTGAAGLRYQRDEAQVEIGWQYQVDANVLVGAAQQMHLYSARGGAALMKQGKLGVIGSVGYGTGTVFDAETFDRASDTAIELLVVDVALTRRLADELGLSLRYGDRRQLRDDGVMAEELVVRRELTLTLEGRYPSREAAKLPRQSLRADGTDETIEAEKVGGRDQPKPE